MATLVTDVPIAGGAASTPARSAVSWAAILAGAVVAIAATLIMLALGSGLGFAVASPWPGSAPTATKFAIGAGIWLIVTQWLSSALAGYIAGRLRNFWAGVHTDEVFFRDTAHGLLAWSVATVIVATVALSASASALGSVTDASGAISYAADTMLRSDRPDAGTSAEIRSEIGRLLAREGPMAADDHAYLDHVVARQTGVSPAEAHQRVDTAIASIRSAADKARKVSSAIGFFTALSMLIGAFIACVAAAYAGRLRDEGELRRV